MTAAKGLTLLLLLISTAIRAAASEQNLKTESHSFGFPFNSSYHDIFSIYSPAVISNEALEITPLIFGYNSSGRIFFNQSFVLWQKEEEDTSSSPAKITTTPTSTNQLASFNTSFIFNIFHIDQSSINGEGLTFLIAPNPSGPPLSSESGFLGLTNSVYVDRKADLFFAVEFDNHKQAQFKDPDDNHVGININSIISNKTASLTPFNITLSSKVIVFHKVWIQYDGKNKTLAVYITKLDNEYKSAPMPPWPVLKMDSLDLSSVVSQRSYFGFSASTGEQSQQLHAVLSWNLTVEVIRIKEQVARADHGELSATYIEKTRVVVVVAVVVVATLVVGPTIGWLFWKRGGSRSADPNILGALKRLPGTPREFKFKDLKKATGNFDKKNNKLGQGGYGVVFKGFLPAENTHVAVKRFSRGDLKSKDDFLAELSIINRLRHRHLVKLLGWCHKNSVLLLVYEYLPNGSLEKHIFCKEDEQPLNWSVRFKILTGVASALHYLHHEYESTVIHRDLKANNIMLDNNFNARLGDFGLARALDQEKTSYAELEGVHGTMGYIAPECFHTSKATRESDIYALGAVFLEVTTGYRPWAKLGGYSCLVDWVWSMHSEKGICEAVDRRLGTNYLYEEVERVLLLGLACSHPVPSERPKTQVIVQVLSGLLTPPHVPPSKPAFMWPAMGQLEVDISLWSSEAEECTPR